MWIAFPTMARLYGSYQRSISPVSRQIRILATQGRPTERARPVPGHCRRRPCRLSEFAMETVKKTKEHTILKKRSGRYGVRTAKGQWVNGDDKLAVLAAAGLATAPVKKKAEPAPEAAAEAEPEAATEAEPETVAEETTE